ncbi:unnamed protein product [Musa acuminata subsp. malaccensis]|uniref:(wild Malaysian banana) hypothetical protein n=1 Tax=Musa acuminata subsp. malaccensis TaxID=214687 RepID=A0A804ISV1_MUSAM|nr:unnamed protein product [Musa acuminata subsp. malaccensis]
MVDAKRRVMVNALLGISNQCFVLLLETCIPLFAFNFTYRYLIFHELIGGVIVPDEHYIPTVLTVRAPHLIANRSLTRKMWKKDHKGHPATFGKVDMNGMFPERINRDRNCSYNDRPSAIFFLFARKFATGALEPLRELASAYSVSVRSSTDAEEVRRIPSTVSDSKSFSTIDAARQLLANALLDLSNEHFILLSLACIPLFNFSFTDNYLMSSEYIFVDAFDMRPRRRRS